MPKSSHPKRRLAKTSHSAATKTTQQLRIIGGQWRGRKLAFPAVDGLRPTGDRIRETLFNWLQAILPGARCLDMYAGSGALGLEALSRGASQVDFIELERTAAQQLQAHLALLNTTETGRVHCTDACEWLARSNSQTEPFDIVFMDPPFQQNLWQLSIDALHIRQWLAEDAYIYIETPAGHPLLLPEHWHPHREKTSGNVRYALYRAHG